MRRILVALAGTVSGLIMLFSYHTSLGGGGGAGVAQAPVPTGTPAGGSATGTATVAGDVVRTRWGPVQVRIALENGRIVNVTAVQYPTGNSHDQVINSYALPVLAREAVAAQSAHIDHVSGATVTSEGYLTSLQSALDRARL